MPELLVFGADSLVGSHFVEHTAHPVHAAGRNDPAGSGLRVRSFRSVDLSATDALRAVLRTSRAEVVVNFAAATEVDAVERERPSGNTPSTTGNAYAVNAEAPRAMAEESARTGKRLITISTDFVFDGVAGPYAEDAEPSPLSSRVSWYGWTKGVGEVGARRAAPGTSVLRIAYPFRSRFPSKLDFARKMLDQRRRGTLPPLFADQRITPTWIPDVSRAIERLIDVPDPGVFHVASPGVTTPWEFGSQLLGLAEGRPADLPKGSMADFLLRPSATPRPRRGGLSIARLPAAGILPTDWKSAVAELLRDEAGR